MRVDLSAPDPCVAVEGERTAEREAIPCPLCGANEPTLWRWGYDRLHGQPGWFRLVRCRRCGLVYLNPRPTAAALRAFYPDDYVSYRRPLAAEPPLRAWERRLGLARRCRVITRRAPPGRLLDVGCGTGDFLLAMVERGWRCIGVELQPHAIRQARRQGLWVLPGDLLDAPLRPDSFDAVTLWDVLEHLPQPRATLERVHALLRPGGLLAVTVPRLDSPEARLFGSYWAGFDVPRHLTVFTRATLERMLHVAGFRIEAFEDVSGRWSACAITLRFLAEDRLRRPALRRAAAALLASRAARLAAWPLFQALAAAGWGATMTAVARKMADGGPRTAWGGEARPSAGRPPSPGTAL
jgi:SAM-dependent methyltransferase